MTLKSGTSQACAACKYQRRKCNSECQLAPYFPPDNPAMFLNAHKLFGVSNISKILKKLDPAQKSEAMNSIIIQANLRAQFPVRGCVEMIERYCARIRQHQLELHAVRSLLAMCHRQHHLASNPPDDDPPSQLQLGMAPPPAPFCPDNYSAYSNSYESVADNPVWVQQNHHDGDVKCVIPVEPQTPAMREELLLQDFDEMKAYNFDSSVFDKQSYVGIKKAYDSSSPESSMTDTMQSIEHIGDNELRNAAACFSLTSVN